MHAILHTLSILSATLLVRAKVLSVDDHWTQFKLQHGRMLSDIDERKTAFIAAKAAVDKHNAEAAEGLHTYTQDVYAHSVMTEQELLTGRKPKPAVGPIPAENIHVSNPRVAVPASMDLRSCNCMPPIENQVHGVCGSCWAFAATTPIEFQNCCLKNLTSPVMLSQQVFVDCTCGGGGCGGGLEYVAWPYLIKYDMGLETITDYPYVAKNQACKYNASKPLVKLAGYKRITPAIVSQTAVADMKQALTMYGVIATGIAVNGNWSGYRSGIFSGSCSSAASAQNHSVTVVGYATDPVTGIEYWIIRNSWGSTWGEAGYIRMKMGINQCGVELDNSYPIVVA